jgi:hypothetical protein
MRYPTRYSVLTQNLKESKQLVAVIAGINNFVSFKTSFFLFRSDVNKARGFEPNGDTSSFDSSSLQIELPQSLCWDA